MRIPELLSPAGNMDALRAALHFGADAVYGGMKRFGLRAFAGNFDPDELREAVTLAHGAGKKFYVTMNCYPFDDELDDFTAAAGLAADGTVDPDRDIGEYLGVRFRAPGFADTPVTLAMLLNHTATVRDSDLLFRAEKYTSDGRTNRILTNSLICIMVCIVLLAEKNERNTLRS